MTIAFNGACSDCELCAGDYTLDYDEAADECTLSRYVATTSGNPLTASNLTCFSNNEPVSPGSDRSSPAAFAANTHAKVGSEGNKIMECRAYSGSGSQDEVWVAMHGGSAGFVFSPTISGDTVSGYTRGLYASLTGQGVLFDIISGNVSSSFPWIISCTANLLLLEWASGVDAAPTVTVLATDTGTLSVSLSGLNQSTPTITALEYFLPEASFPSGGNAWAIGIGLSGISITYPSSFSPAPTILRVTAPGMTLRSAWNTTGYPATLTIT